MPDPTPPPPPPPPDEPARNARASLLEVVGAVFWSFFGVRRGQAMRRDAVAIPPHQVIFVGIVLAAVLVASLVGLGRGVIDSRG